MMNTLMDAVSGSYNLRTTSGTRYVIDLDEMSMIRYPNTAGMARVGRTAMRSDQTSLRLLRIVECTVGRPAAFLVDLDIPGVPFTLRSTTTLQSIETARGAV